LKKKIVIGILLTLFLTSMLTAAFNIQPVKANGTIYIRADGSIDPPTAPILTVDNVTYTFTGNITSDADGIVVEKDNIVVDGARYTLQGTGVYPYKGIDLTSRSNVTIKNTRINAFWCSIYLSGSSGNSVSGNNITNNDYGILFLWSSNCNRISGNNITANKNHGISLFDSSDNNSISGNNLRNNGEGIELWSSSSNSMVGNNITNMWDGITLTNSSNNKLRDNNMSDNQYNFGVYGLELSDLINDVDSSNTVDGKLVCYWVNRHDEVVPADAGYVAVVNSTDITVKNLDLKNNGQGILLAYSKNSTITGNNVTNNWVGLLLAYTNNSKITNNSITNNWYGILLGYSSGNSVSGNSVTANKYSGIRLYESSGNNIYHNNFVDNSEQVDSDGSTNVWDDGYPSGGNYWSDYTGVDANEDAIGDTPYIIDANNTDRYPLIAPITVFDAGTWNGEAYSVDIVSNSTLSDFKLNVTQKTLSFNVTGIEGKAGFCRITIPNAIVEDLWHGNYTVLLNGEPWPFRNWTDTTNTYIYINYTHSEHEIVIIPEFTSTIILPLFTLTTLIATILLKKKRKTKPQFPNFFHAYKTADSGRGFLPQVLFLNEP
jgi:parallel beta-helix repeat protein